MDNVQFSQIYNNDAVVLSKKKKNIITLTQKEFLAVANGSNKNSKSDNLIFKRITGKLLPTNQVAQKQSPIKRIVMNKNKIIPISPTLTVRIN